MKQPIVMVVLWGLVTQALAMEQPEARPAASAVATSSSSNAADAMQPSVQTTPVIVTQRSQDRLELETTQITGNRELPRVLYVVPWKRSDLGDMGGKPANSLLDEVLAPVDRDVFRRQNRYYQALKPDSSGTIRPGGAEVEK